MSVFRGPPARDKTLVRTLILGRLAAASAAAAFAACLCARVLL